MNKQPNSRHCFICGVENAGGVQTAFYDVEHTDGSHEVEARFVARHEHQGYPGRLHGGVASGILDETIGRAINAGSAGSETTWGVAIELAVRFHQPVPLGVELTARGRITGRRSRTFEGTGELLLPDGRVAVSARGRYLAMPLERISGDVDLDELGWRVVEETEGA